MAAKNCVFWCELMLLPILMFAISCHKHKIHLYLLYGVINNSRNCCKDTLKDNLECNDYFFIYFILEMNVINLIHWIWYHLSLHFTPLYNWHAIECNDKILFWPLHKFRMLLALTTIIYFFWKSVINYLILSLAIYHQQTFSSKQK